jgi:hypothetical protein
MPEKRINLPDLSNLYGATKKLFAHEIPHPTQQIDIVAKQDTRPLSQIELPMEVVSELTGNADLAHESNLSAISLNWVRIHANSYFKFCHIHGGQSYRQSVEMTRKTTIDYCRRLNATDEEISAILLDLGLEFSPSLGDKIKSIFKS